MGTNHSNLNNGAFPIELIIEILSLLSLHDLTSCRRINRALNDIVNVSQRLQHRFDTAAAGVVDNPNSTLSLLERRAALARRQEAWDTWKPQVQNVVTSNVCFLLPDVKQNGVYFLWNHPDFPGSVGYRFAPPPNKNLDETWQRLCLQRKRDVYIIIQVAPSLENDLVAVGIDHENPPTHTLEVDLLCFSKGIEHPLAAKSTLIVKRLKRGGISAMNMDICMNLFVVLIHWIGPYDEVLVYDWKTGEMIQRLQDRAIDAVRFLKGNILLIANRSLPALELFTVPDGAGLASMKIAALGLPSLDRGAYLACLDFCNLPTRDSDCFQAHSHEAATFVKPFRCASPDDIINIALRLHCRRNSDKISFVVHSSALIHHGFLGGHVDRKGTIPWRSWGPTVTRWYQEPTYHMNNFSGQCCLIFSITGRSFEIWDFNPYRVRRLGKHFKSENETACLSVETEPSQVISEGLKQEVVSSLPYVKLVVKQPPIFGFECLDDDRVFVRQIISLGSSCAHKMNQFYFG